MSRTSAPRVHVHLLAWGLAAAQLGGCSKAPEALPDGGGGGGGGGDSGGGGGDLRLPLAARFGALQRWSVPMNGLSSGFHATDNEDGRNWYTLDMNGDGKPDLVATSDPTKAGTVWDAAGSPYWKVHLNTGAGFAPSVKWSVPKSGLLSGFFAPRASGAGQYWATVDLNGDRLPDLVQTGDPTRAGAVWDAAGAPYWKVFLNSGTGFGQAMNWPVPKNGLNEGFHTADLSQDYRHWTLVDLDGDRRPDLVQTGDPAKIAAVWDSAGMPYWKVALNSGSGFAQPVNWVVPGSGASDGFFAARSGNGSRYWTLLDLNGDGRMDLVQTADPSKLAQVWDAGGAPYWKVFFGTGSGFGPPTNWVVPGSGLSAGFFSTAVATTGQFWSTMDMDGDGLPDLVQTADSSKGAQVWDPTGASYWKVFTSSGSGFGAAISWSVPGSGQASGFFAASNAGSAQYWRTLDMDGDRRPDLVQTADSNLSAQVWDAAGAPYWKVFPAAP